MTDLNMRAWREAADDCAGHPDLFDERELERIHVIGLRLTHGMALSRNQQDLLTAGAERVRETAARQQTQRG